MTSVDDVGEPLALHDVLSRDEEDPGTKAARKMDWEDFMAVLSPRDQAVIECLIEGKTGSAMARKLRVSDWAIKNSKRRLRIKIAEFMGPEILIEIQRRPQWKQNLEATREKMACKHQRCH